MGFPYEEPMAVGKNAKFKIKFTENFLKGDPYGQPFKFNFRIRKKVYDKKFQQLFLTITNKGIDWNDGWNSENMFDYEEGEGRIWDNEIIYFNDINSCRLQFLYTDGTKSIIHNSFQDDDYIIYLENKVVDTLIIHEPINEQLDDYLYNEKNKLDLYELSIGKEYILVRDEGRIKEKIKIYDIRPEVYTYDNGYRRTIEFKEPSICFNYFIDYKTEDCEFMKDISNTEDTIDGYIVNVFNHTQTNQQGKALEKKEKALEKEELLLQKNSWPKHINLKRLLKQPKHELETVEINNLHWTVKPVKGVNFNNIYNESDDIRYIENICLFDQFVEFIPKGYRMPTIQEYLDLDKLNKTITNKGIIYKDKKNELFLPLHGYCGGNGFIHDTGKIGHFWTSLKDFKCCTSIWNNIVLTRTHINTKKVSIIPDYSAVLMLIKEN